MGTLFTPKDWDDGPGPVLLDSNGHWWRLDVSTSGVISTTDLGTTPPSDTPLEAVAIEDLEDRVTDYADFSRGKTAMFTEAFASLGAFTTIQGSSLAASGGVLAWSGSSGANETLITRTSEQAVDVRVLAKITLGSNRTSPFGLIFRVIDSSNYILLSPNIDDASPFSEVSIYKKVSGSFTQLNSAVGGAFPHSSAYRPEVNNSLYIAGQVRGRTLSAAIYPEHPDYCLFPVAWAIHHLSDSDYTTFDDPDDFGIRGTFGSASNGTLDDYTAYAL